MGWQERLGINVEPEIFPAGTDSRFVRAIGVPCFGFCACQPKALHPASDRGRFHVWILVSDGHI